MRTFSTLLNLAGIRTDQTDWDRLALRAFVIAVFVLGPHVMRDLSTDVASDTPTVRDGRR